MKDVVSRCVCGGRPSVELRPRGNGIFDVEYYVRCPDCRRESGSASNRMEATHLWNMMTVRLSHR